MSPNNQASEIFLKPFVSEFLTSRYDFVLNVMISGEGQFFTSLYLSFQ